MDRGIWWATVPGVAKSRTCLSKLLVKHKNQCILMASKGQLASETSSGLSGLVCHQEMGGSCGDNNNFTKVTKRSYCHYPYLNPFTILSQTHCLIAWAITEHRSFHSSAQGMCWSPTIITPSASTFPPNQTSPLPQNSTGDLTPITSLPSWPYQDDFCCPNFHFNLYGLYGTDNCLSR